MVFFCPPESSGRDECIGLAERDYYRNDTPECVFLENVMGGGGFAQKLLPARCWVRIYRQIRPFFLVISPSSLSQYVRIATWMLKSRTGYTENGPVRSAFRTTVYQFQARRLLLPSRINTIVC